MLKPYYRIARYKSWYQVQVWRWWLPFWVTNPALANYHDTMEAAEAYAKAGCRNPVVMYLGQL
jgi:hypothetical protein